MKNFMYVAIAVLVLHVAVVNAQGTLTNVVSKSDFNAKVLQSSKPVVVKFFATWCGSCKSMKPVLDRIAGQYSDTYDFIAVDVDKGKALADQYNISGLPTLVFFKNGKEVGRRVGDGQDQTVIAAIKQALG